MKNVFFALAVICTAFGATAMTNVTPGDVYVQTSPGFYEKLLVPYNPANCIPDYEPCAFIIPSGDNTFYPPAMYLQTALDYELIPHGEGIYCRVRGK